MTLTDTNYIEAIVIHCCQGTLLNTLQTFLVVIYISFPLTTHLCSLWGRSKESLKLILEATSCNFLIISVTPPVPTRDVTPLESPEGDP